MPIIMTISVPDDTYESLKSAGEQSHLSPEEVGNALSDALEQSELSILDLIERRQVTVWLCAST